MIHDLSDMGELVGGDGPVKIKVIESHAPLLANRTPTRATAPYANGRYHVKQESARQRIVLELAAKGKTNKEIAELTGYNSATVSALLRQPHTQQILVDEVRRNVDNIDAEVLAVIKEGCLVGAKRLLEIVKNPKAKGSEHVAAAKTFLERRYGMPNQPINANTSVDLNNLSDAELAKGLIEETLATGTSEHS